LTMYWKHTRSWKLKTCSRQCKRNFPVLERFFTWRDTRLSQDELGGHIIKASQRAER
jgi:hypothetical protein